MKLLIVTQKVDLNDPILGFFHEWIKRMAGEFEHIDVICLGKGTYSLPPNVSVHSLGKEEGRQVRRYLLRFYYYIRSLRYDSVFVHMNPIYVILGGLYWKYKKKKIILWYTHKSVDWKLRLAEKIADTIFSASKESFRIRSKKVVITGHGIDTDFFKPNTLPREDSLFHILSIGRLSETKGHHVIIRAVALMHQSGTRVRLTVIGGPISSDDITYETDLKRLVEEKDMKEFVVFTGPISQKSTLPYFQEADVSVNASKTGSLDKTILESMACSTPALSSNIGTKDMLQKIDSYLVFKEDDAEDLKNKLIHFANHKDPELKRKVREEVVNHHDLRAFIPGLASLIKKV